MKAAADSNLKRVSLELGGKSPLIIFDDIGDGKIKRMKPDDSALFRTHSYITKICYFEYLPSLVFGWQKTFFSSVQSNILPNYILSPTFFSKSAYLPQFI